MASRIRAGHLEQRTGQVGAQAFQRQDPAVRTLAPDLADLVECAVGDDRAPAFREVQHVGELVASRAGIDRHEDRAEDRRGHHQVDELGMVVHHHREGVARLHAERPQLRSDALAVLPELGVGPGLVDETAVRGDVHERQDVAVRLGRGSSANQVREDLRTASHRLNPRGPGC